MTIDSDTDIAGSASTVEIFLNELNIHGNTDNMSITAGGTNYKGLPVSPDLFPLRYRDDHYMGSIRYSEDSVTFHLNRSGMEKAQIEIDGEMGTARGDLLVLYLLGDLRNT